MNHLFGNGTNDDAPKAPPTPEAEAPLLEKDTDNMVEVLNQSEDGGSGVEDEVMVDPPANVGESDPQLIHEVIASGDEDDAPKKSYASIVKVMKGSPSLAPVHSTSKAKVALANPEKPLVASPSPAPVPETSIPASHSVPEDNSLEDEGHWIYIRNLPLNATAEQVEEEFKKFGPSKPGGVQVEQYCFGFVEFVSLKSMQAAIEASPIRIGGCHAIIKEKRTTTRVANGNGNAGRWHPQLGRGAFRNDEYRGRGSFSSSMGYRRTELRTQVEYSGHSDGYKQQAFQNGNGSPSQLLLQHTPFEFPPLFFP